MRRRWPAVVLAAAGLASLAAWYALRPPHLPEPPEFDLDGADAEVVRAVGAARAAVRAEPGSGRAWGRLAQVLLANGYDAQALPCLTRAAALQPDEPRWPYLRACRLLLADRAAALPDLLRAVELCDEKDPENTTPRLLLAEVHLEEGDFARAATLCRAVLGRQPDNPRAHFALGVAAFETDDLDASLAHLSRAATHPTTRRRACVRLAALSRRLGNRAAAAAFGRRAEEGPPDRPWYDPYVGEVDEHRAGRQDRYLAAERLEAEGRLAEGAGVLRALAEEASDGRSHLALGTLLAKMGDYRGAEPVLREALRSAPERSGTHYALAVVLFERGEALRRAGGRAESCYREVVALARRAAELRPNHAMAYLFEGLALRCLGRADEAIASFRTACRCRPELVGPHLNLGELLAERGQREEALRHLREAVRLAPANDPRPRAALERVQGSATTGRQR